MSLPVWPATVQFRSRRDGYRLVEPDIAPLETEFEGGDVRRRPRATVTRQIYQFVWDLEGNQFQTFATFYRETLGKGSLRFTMQVFVSGSYVSRTCQFKGMYEATRPGNFWRVSAQLYVFGDA